MSITSHDKIVNDGIIYGILFSDNSIYIGQTVNTINHRRGQHKDRAFREKRESKLYDKMRKVGEDNYFFILIENNISLEFLDAKESYYINKFENVLNSTKGKTINGGEFRKINNENDIREIYELLKDESVSIGEIAEKFDVSNTEIGYINRGEHHRIFSKNRYPIRKTYKKNKNSDILEIAKLLSEYNNEKTITEYRREIGLIYDKSLESIRSIDNGVSAIKITSGIYNYPISKFGLK